MPESNEYSLINACFSSLQEAAALLEAEPALLQSRTGLGETALHYLAVENQLSAVTWLVERGASVNVVNEVGTTPLSDAASLGYVEMVQLLLRHGAEINLPAEAEPTLVSAVRSGDARVVALILAAGADPNEHAEGDETPLHSSAASSDAPEVVRVLLQAGADVQALHFDETPLDVANRHGHSQAEQVLRLYGEVPRRGGESAP